MDSASVAVEKFFAEIAIKLSLYMPFLLTQKHLFPYLIAGFLLGKSSKQFPIGLLQVTNEYLTFFQPGTPAKYYFMGNQKTLQVFSIPGLNWFESMCRDQDLILLKNFATISCDSHLSSLGLLCKTDVWLLRAHYTTNETHVEQAMRLCENLQFKTKCAIDDLFTNDVKNDANVFMNVFRKIFHNIPCSDVFLSNKSRFGVSFYTEISGSCCR